MSDISSAKDASQQLSLLTQQYEKQRKELKKELDEQLKQTKEEYDDRILEQRKSGDAAVSHIKKDTLEKIRQAENAAEEQRSVNENQMKEKKEALYKGQAAQEAYLEQAKKKHAQWADEQFGELNRQKERVKTQADNQIENLKGNSNERVARADQRLRKEQEEVNSTGQERLQKMRENYTKRTQDLEAKHAKTSSELHAIHQRSLDGERDSFNSRMKESKEGHSKELIALHEGFVQEKEGTKRQSEAEIERQRQRAGERIRETQKEGQKTVSVEREKYQKAHSQLLQTQRQNMEKVNDQNQKVLGEVKTRHEKDRIRQNAAFAKETQERTERHNIKRDKMITAQQKDLQTLEQGQERQMMDQELSFEKRYQANEQEARRTFTNQAAILSEELVNQKAKFINAADKYSNKSHDPFYQIRDNKTELSETSGAYVFKAKIPEHEKDDVYVKVKQNKLMLSGNRSFNEKIDGEGHVLKTNNTQTFQESYHLPRKIKEDEIVKDYKNGVLTVIIPKV